MTSIFQSIRRRRHQNIPELRSFHRSKYKMLAKLRIHVTNVCQCLPNVGQIVADVSPKFARLRQCAYYILLCIFFMDLSFQISSKSFHIRFLRMLGYSVWLRIFCLCSIVYFVKILPKFTSFFSRLDVLRPGMRCSSVQQLRVNQFFVHY